MNCTVAGIPISAIVPIAGRGALLQIFADFMFYMFSSYNPSNVSHKIIFSSAVLGLKGLYNEN